MTTARTIGTELVDEAFDDPTTITKHDWRYYVPKETREQWRLMRRAKRFEAMVKAEIEKLHTLQ